MYEVEQNLEIEGLFYIENCIEDKDLLSKIDKYKWTPISNSKNSRLVQHYGYHYSYFTKDALKEAPAFPEHIVTLEKILHHICVELQLIEPKYTFNQCIINNYYNGQCISKHTDAKIFGNVIGCFSLNSEAIMKFTNQSEEVNVKILPNSLYIMSGNARYKWMHEMIKLNKDERRISVTFRNV